MSIRPALPNNEVLAQYAQQLPVLFSETLLAFRGAKLVLYLVRSALVQFKRARGVRRSEADDDVVDSFTAQVYAQSLFEVVLFELLSLTGMMFIHAANETSKLAPIIYLKEEFSYMTLMHLVAHVALGLVIQFFPWVHTNTVLRLMDVPLTLLKAVGIAMILVDASLHVIFVTFIINLLDDKTMGFMVFVAASLAFRKMDQGLFQYGRELRIFDTHERAKRVPVTTVALSSSSSSSTSKAGGGKDKIATVKIDLVKEWKILPQVGLRTLAESPAKQTRAAQQQSTPSSPPSYDFKKRLRFRRSRASVAIEFVGFDGRYVLSLAPEALPKGYAVRMVDVAFEGGEKDPVLAVKVSLGGGAEGVKPEEEDSAALLKWLRGGCVYI